MNMEIPKFPSFDARPERTLTGSEALETVTPRGIEQEKDRHIHKYVQGYKGQITNIFFWEEESGADEKGQVRIAFDSGDEPVFSVSDQRLLFVSDTPFEGS